ncbi:TetR/AcrR family transcriptional regulator [Streptomyces sp. NPDC057638]|uniref:TetR/AcrR family transcriptional regulator n=1 Tax=Streptomyces sp. NPDC057638 TaxID=3346190 RepID=UPI0036C23BC8
MIADTALALLAERGMRGLTHRAVDEAAALPQGSTSNHFRTRQALLEATVRRLAERDAAVLDLDALRTPDGGAAGLADTLAGGLHRYLTGGTALLIARYELALEATRRPELRTVYDTAGARFRALVTALLEEAGSADPRRHARTLLAWTEGTLVSHAVGADREEPPSLDSLRASYGELLRPLLP